MPKHVITLPSGKPCVHVSMEARIAAAAERADLLAALGALLGETLPRDTPAQRRARAAIAKASQE